MELVGFGKRLLKARLAVAAMRGTPMSQREVAEMVGVHQKTVAAWEQGKKEPSLEMIRKLGKALAIEPGRLAFGSFNGFDAEENSETSQETQEPPTIRDPELKDPDIGGEGRGRKEG